MAPGVKLCANPLANIIILIIVNVLFTSDIAVLPSFSGFLKKYTAIYIPNTEMKILSGA